MSDDIDFIHKSLLNGCSPHTLGEAAVTLPYPVFACNSSKHPITTSGFYDASTDPEVILSQFSSPSAAMIGIPTGTVSGITVIDVDVKAGARGMDWLNENSARLPSTRTHKTRSGGLHLVFRTPEGVEIGNSAGRIAPGVDVRGIGGYIIAPPSPGYSVADPIEPAKICLNG